MARGFAETGSFLDRLPDETRGRLAWLLAELGTEVSAAQKAALASKTHGTGFLSGGLGVDVLLERLRVRIGLLALQAGRRSSRYYGRFVEFGRRAQTVRVIRGTSASPKSASVRRKHNQRVRGAYTLRVRAMAPREFIFLPDLEARADRRLADFWSEIL